jgi:hypothetical protein
MSTSQAEDAASASIEAPAEDPADNSQTQPADEEAPDSGGEDCNQPQPDNEKSIMERPRSGRMQRNHHIRDRYIRRHICRLCQHNWPAASTKTEEQ